MSLTVVTSTPTTTNNTTNQTSHTFNLPTTDVKPGDWFVAIVGVNATDSVLMDTSTWQQMRGDRGVYNGFALLNLFWKYVDGDEGSTDTFTTSGSTKSCIMVYHCRGGNPEIYPPKYTYATSGGTTTSPNPPSHTSPYGNQEHLWIAAVFHSSTGSTTGYPTDYIGTAALESGGTDGIGVATGYRIATAATEDPSNFTWGTARTAGQITIGIPTLEVSVSSGFPKPNRRIHQGFAAATSQTVALPDIKHRAAIMHVTAHHVAAPVLTTPTGWTQLGSFVDANSSGSRNWWYYRQGDGTEQSTLTLTFTDGDSHRTGVVIWVMEDADMSTDPPSKTTSAPATSTTFDPPSHTPAGGSAKYLWLIGAGVLNSTFVTADPTNYENMTGHRSTFDSGGPIIQTSAWRTNEASSEDPGSYTVDTSREAVHFTMSVKGVPFGYMRGRLNSKQDHYVQLGSELALMSGRKR